MASSPAWGDRVRRACERLIQDIELTLPLDANFVDFERAVMKYSPEMFRETLQALVDAGDFPLSNGRGA